MKKHQKKVYKRFFGIVIVTLIACIVLGIVWNWNHIIYPPLQRYTPSPKLFVQQHGRLLPDAASINLEVLEHGSRTSPKIALTFDADMTPGMLLLLRSGVVKSWYNAEIMEILNQENVKATVFLGGLWTKTYPIAAKALAINPLIEIGNHSYNHYAFTVGCFSLPSIPDSDDASDVEMAQQIIQKTTGVTPKYFRFPGGCMDNVDLLAVARLGLTIVHWDLAAGDGFQNDPNVIVWNVEHNVQNGSIIVLHFHDGTLAPKTAPALRILIPYLRSKGFEFVKLSELEKE
jgi:peptidoglycan-N-acetylglucosamine deacetylase